ncbi:MAG: hypothetical protein JXA73_08795 [Acidobacteria bacterium]|nr:hypothetical protein [Acidobacteriota bacterium]
MDETTKEAPVLFDANKPITLKTFGLSGIKPITLRFPSDDEWLERASRRKTIIEFTPTGDSISTVLEPDEEEIELLKNLAIDALPEEIDAHEAGRLIDQLEFTLHENPGEVIQGDQLHIILRVPGAVTTHKFRMPSSKELNNYDRKLHDQQPYGKKKISSVRNLPFLRDLYGKMILESSGYSGGTPIIHQADALFLAFINLKQEIDSTKNF